MKTQPFRFTFSVVAILGLVCASAGAFAQDTSGTGTQSTGAQADGVTKTPPIAEKPDPLKRRLSDHEERAQRQSVKAELKGEYKKWLDEDVRWIISDEEEKAFKSLANDEERDQFAGCAFTLCGGAFAV